MKWIAILFRWGWLKDRMEWYYEYYKQKDKWS